METHDWAKVFTGSPTDAEMVRGVLEGSGIESVIKRLGGGAYGLDPGPLGETTVNVRADDAARAREVLGDEGHTSPEPDEPWLEERHGSSILSRGTWIMRAAVLVVIAVLLYEAVT